MTSKGGPCPQARAAAMVCRIVGLDDQLDVETIARPVEAAKRGHQIGDEVRLVQQRYEDRVDRQVIVASIDHRCRIGERAPGDEAGGDEAQNGNAEEEEGADQIEHHDGRHRLGAEGKHDRGGEGEPGNELAAGDDPARRQVGIEDREPVDGVDGEACGAGADQRRADRGRRSNAQALPGGRVARQPMGDLGQRLFLGRHESCAGGARRLGKGAAPDRRHVDGRTGVEPDFGCEGQPQPSCPLGIHVIGTAVGMCQHDPATAWFDYCHLPPGTAQRRTCTASHPCYCQQELCNP